MKDIECGCVRGKKATVKYKGRYWCDKCYNKEWKRDEYNDGISYQEIEEQASADYIGLSMPSTGRGR
jgi:hypothetical protein